MSDVDVAPLARSSPWINEIARHQFAHWGVLTGQSSQNDYADFLRVCAGSRDLPRTLVASRRDVVLGSVNLMRAEMTIRPELTPWMGQLFVMPEARGMGVGERLCEAVAQCAAALGFVSLYLFTSGTLPAYYRTLGWSHVEEIEYLGKLRSIMRRSVG